MILLKFIEILRGRRVAKKGVMTNADRKTINRVKSDALTKLSALLSENDKVMIELSDAAVPYFLDILDDPAFSVYRFQQYDEYHYIFSNRTLII